MARTSPRLVGMKSSLGPATVPDRQPARRKGKYEATRARHHGLGSSVRADERETGREVHQRQDRGPAGIGGDRLHRDIERFTERLIAVREPQLWSDLGGTQLDTHLLCAPMDLRVGDSIRFEPELRDRQNNELHLPWC